MGGDGSGKLNASLVVLDGTMVAADGSTRESDFFEFLRLPADHTADLTKVLSADAALAFRQHIIRMKVGTSAQMPILCGGPRCPVARCPFAADKNWPLAQPCPIEETLIATWMRDYIEELGVLLENRTEMVLVNKLVECDLIDYRANTGFSVDPDAWRLLKTDVSSDGERTTEITNAHPLIDIKEKTQRVRLAVLESFASTRREKYKRAAALKRRDEDTIGDHFANLKQALAATRETPVVADDPDVQDADWETSDF